MLSRLKVLFLLPLFLFGKTTTHAQDNDYLRHNKFFYLCSYQRECSNCYDCGKQKYSVKIKNNTDKKIKKVSYVFFSDVYNRILTKEAKMDGNIDPKSTGRLYVCIPNGKHWAKTELVYEDDTNTTFVVKDRLDNFEQEPDECDCNPTTNYPNPNIN